MAVSAYAALLSLADVLNNVQHPACRHPLHLYVDKIQSLQEKVQFLQDFLEVHSQRKSRELEDLAGQIRVVADDVEDIIDLHVVYQLHEGSQNESHHLQATPSSFCEEIDKVITKIDSITKELMMIKEDWSSTDIQEQKPIPSQPAGSSTGLPSTRKDSTMVGFDESLLHIVDELTKDESNLRILPIVGWEALIKIGKGDGRFCWDEMLEPTKLRCLFLEGYSYYSFQSSSLHLLWNLKSLLVDFSNSPNTPSVLPNEIWEMPQLRHLKCQNALLPNPTATQCYTILENLHTLSGILNFRCTKEVVERIPNLKKLKVMYYSVDSEYSSIDSEKCSGYCLEDLAYLHKLESLTLSIISFTWRWEELPLYEMFGLGAGDRMYIAFPDSLKKLSLEGGGIPWENAMVIGSLPNLEVPKLLRHAFHGPEWNPEEGQFSRLKALYITESNLVWWRAETTLHSIYLERCSKSATISAKQIGVEQHNNGNELEVRAHWSNLTRWRIAFYAVLFLVRSTRALNHEDHWGESEYPSSPIEPEYLSSPAESEFPYSESESGD
ncbi:hypothetical protein Sango_2509900 [Sesamum angolense]|uniref:Rx N-terminal domain-containing protein n=1 Tax=Sesamum angolense TaxID=2727404 RepID=A0AAE1W411_9LAMI|nr:hypothetical protein Sango_2509900 [Sesamum angolense]